MLLPVYSVCFRRVTEVFISSRIMSGQRSGNRGTTDPFDRELEERLAKLKGLDPNRYSAPPITVYHPPSNLTQAEQSDNLLKRMLEEVSLDERTASCSRSPVGRRVSTDEEIALRLARLRDENVNQESNQGIEEVSMDSEEEADLAAERFLAESRLPRVPSNLNISKEKEETETPPDDEELPWCVICNEDAKLRCLSCDSDLYCLQCFRDFHNDSDMRKHKTVTFHKKSGPTI